MYTVFVRGLEFYAYHGVPPEERAVGHRYCVDLDLEVEGRADATDRVEDTVDYARAAQIAQAYAQGCQVHTVERLAAGIADEMLAAFPSIVRTRVRVGKVMPPAPVVASEAGVELARTRGDS